MAEKQTHLPNKSSHEEKERVVAWLWLWDREEEYDYQREVWKSLGISHSGPDDTPSLDMAVPITESEAGRILNQFHTGSVDLYSKFGITSLKPMIGLPRGPYYDPVDTSAIMQTLKEALEDSNQETNKSQKSSEPSASNASQAISLISDSLVEKVKNEFGRDPDVLFKLPPTEFSNLIAELLRDMGADVCKVQGSPETGADILAYFTLPTSQKILTVVECKQIRRERKVGPSLIKQFLFTAREHYHATQAMFVTSGHFSPDAHYWEEQYKWFLSLRDYDVVCEWLSQYGKWKTSSAGGIWVPEKYQELLKPAVGLNITVINGNLSIGGDVVGGNKTNIQLDNHQ